MKSIYTEIKNYFCSHFIPEECGKTGLSALGIKILVAASAGPDSTTLALCLAELQEEMGISLVLAYYDHGIRAKKDSQSEEEFVISLGERLKVPVVTDRAGEHRLEDIAVREKKSLEAVARDFRYAFLRETAGNHFCKYIALGHTRTDRIETQV